MKKIVILLVLMMLVFAGCGQQQPAEQSNSETTPEPNSSFPERSLEFVACYSPGGGHDIMLRTMAKIIQDEKIIDTPINVVNKPGGSGAVGMAYVEGHKGDGHYLMAATSSFITTPLTSEVGVNYKNYTPIARFGIDPELLLANTSSQYKTLEDIINSNDVINVGGTGTGGMEHITFTLLEKEIGKDLNYIPFQGDGEVVAALMGNQVDVIIANPSAAYDYVESGDFRALAISTEKRTELMPDVPTFKELGYDIVLSLFRGVVAPGEITAEQKAFYEDMVKKLVATDAWKKDYLDKNLIVEGYLNSDDFAAYLDEVNDLYKTTLTELGIIK